MEYGHGQGRGVHGVVSTGSVECMGVYGIQDVGVFMGLRIRGSRLVVRLPPTETRTDTGLYIPLQTQEPPMEGRVLAVGDCLGEEVKPGDRVVFEQWAGLEHEDETWGPVLILEQKDLMAVLER